MSKQKAWCYNICGIKKEDGVKIRQNTLIPLSFWVQKPKVSQIYCRCHQIFSYIAKCGNVQNFVLKIESKLPFFLKKSTRTIMRGCQCAHFHRTNTITIWYRAPIFFTVWVVECFKICLPCLHSTKIIMQFRMSQIQNNSSWTRVQLFLWLNPPTYYNIKIRDV